MTKDEIKEMLIGRYHEACKKYYTDGNTKFWDNFQLGSLNEITSILLTLGFDGKELKKIESLYAQTNNE